MITAGSVSYRVRRNRAVLAAAFGFAVALVPTASFGQNLGSGQFQIVGTSLDISPEAQAELWRPFYTARTSAAGHGLGLPIARGIVEAHGGHIWVESAPGQGSTFAFTLPNEPPSEEEPNEAAGRG